MTEEATEYEWAVRFSVDGNNYIQSSEEAARALVAESGGTLLRRSASVHQAWTVVETR